MKGSKTAVVLLTLALSACEEPTDTQPLEGVYLLDRVNGRALPAQVCAGDDVDQVMLYESIAMDTAGTYGRFQLVRVGEEEVEQQEHGEWLDTDSTFLLINAAEDTLVLTLLDEEAQRLRRLHPCGDTLRYSQARVVG